MHFTIHRKSRKYLHNYCKFFVSAALLTSCNFVMAKAAQAQKENVEVKQAQNTKPRNTTNHSQDNLFDNGFGFIGAEIGVGGLGNFSAGIMGGYQYYFPEEWQFHTFRHGVRGFVSANWLQYNYTSYLRDVNYSGLFIQAGADWTLEFNPQSNFVWGVFVGLSLGYLNIFSNDSFFVHPRSFVVSGNGGGSLTMYKNHRVDLALGSGFSLFAVRYLFMF
ncbi:hypothetical protein CQA66_01540 [Helicobacter aurati]|uniref:Outer membrane beta-barrel protein n=1 Tax=Helicobacter aurati TaxID=137778 RepID=A0A3D8J8D6_9HELI|nr:hypothetical protein [Helicobacter aurati]RDU73376.1 hypothetical protein CQA66_01540 [Helicobacter aurati]